MRRQFKASPKFWTAGRSGGRVDYLMRVAAPSMAAYQEFMEGLLQVGLRIDQYYSLIVTKSVKSNSPFPCPRQDNGEWPVFSTEIEATSVNSSATNVHCRGT
ncbi:hypothetical protein [Mesorhizobium sp.]|uniref:hypothetical protein n=1 Tax=Mesorhizobium sp. TaxID=1871066 RepID=UPI003450C44C